MGDAISQFVGAHPLVWRFFSPVFSPVLLISLVISSHSFCITEIGDARFLRRERERVDGRSRLAKVGEGEIA